MNQDDFARFLAWLSSNPEEAAQLYEKIRRWLIKLFRAWGCPEVEAEELTDETISRVVGKISEIADSYVGAREPYIRRVAHYVFLEYLRRPRPAAPPEPQYDSSEEKERRDQCLEHCLAQLPPDDRDAVLRYYAEDKQTKKEQRREQAEQLGMTLNALRIYIHRVREALRKCITDCLSESTS